MFELTQVLTPLVRQAQQLTAAVSEHAHFMVVLSESLKTKTTVAGHQTQSEAATERSDQQLMDTD